MSARDQRLIEAKMNGHLARTTTRLPVVTTHAAGESRSQPQSWKTVLGLGAAFLAGVALLAYFQPWQTGDSTSPAESDGRNALKTVNVVRPAPAATASVVLPATFRPWQTAALHARVSGYLTAWHRDLGSPVKAGELLAEIE